MNIIRLFSYIFLAIGLLGGFISSIDAAIDFDVTPIKYELDTNPGESITLPATLINKGTGSFSIITGTSDFEPTGNTGQPRFVRYSELVHPDQQLSTWITLGTGGFTIGGGETKVINFTIDIPSNATPGGHYGAVFFKNNASEASAGGTVGINVDYGILILLNVNGDVTSTGSVGDISIGGGSTGGYDQCGPDGDLSGNRYDGTCEASISGSGNTTDIFPDIDNCVIDFTSSNFDGKCFDNPFESLDNEVVDNTQNENQQGGDDHQSNNVDNGQDEDFNVIFDVPFENNGNVHIKPSGEIVVKNENGDIIKDIGEKLIKNDRGAVIGKEIVDYLPINDEDGNVLPDSTRNFIYEWRGFPYRDINGDIAYRTPGEYYTIQNQQEAGFLMFWERVCTRKQYKTLTADIDLSYINDVGEEVEFNSAQEFKIQYIEQYIGINPYVILPILLLLILWLGWWWFILAFKRKVCINKDCKKKIKKNAKVCPHCEAIQDKKKYKAQKATAMKKKKTKKK